MSSYTQQLEEHIEQLQEKLTRAETLLHASVVLTWYRLPKNENRWDLMIIGIPNTHIATILRFQDYYQLSWAGTNPIYIPSNYPSLKQAQDEAREILKVRAESYIKIAL
jgi:hypothetical protein